MEVYAADGLIANAAHLEGDLRCLLEGISGSCPGRVRAVRGRGLLAAIELDATPDKMRQISSSLNTRRVMTHLRPNEGTIILSPPLCITASELAEGVERLSESIREVLN